jgi:hypothetical protein
MDPWTTMMMKRMTTMTWRRSWNKTLISVTYTYRTVLAFICITVIVLYSPSSDTLLRTPQEAPLVSRTSDHEFCFCISQLHF